MPGREQDGLRLSCLTTGTVQRDFVRNEQRVDQGLLSCMLLIVPKDGTGQLGAHESVLDRSQLSPFHRALVVRNSDLLKAVQFRDPWSIRPGKSWSVQQGTGEQGVALAACGHSP